MGTINPLGLRTTSVLDLLNRTVATQDQLGSLTTVVYDEAGNQVNYVDPLGNKTTFVYDALNRQTEHIDALGKKATFAYDAISRMTSTTDRLSRRRDFGYDAVNQKTTEGWINSGGTTANLLTFSYDAVGNQLTAGDYDGFYTFTYDALNRVHTVKNPTGQTLTMGYDVVGRRINMEDSFGSTVQSVFDDAGQLLRQDLAGPTNLRVDLTYTDRHQLATIQRYSDLIGSAGVARTSFTYDDKGRLTDLHHRKTSDGSTISNYTYTFDAKDRLLTESLNGTVKTYVYDNTDQVTADGTNTFTYDANGNRTNTGYSTGTGNRLLSDGTWNFTYDDEGNQTKKVRISDGRTWTYAFDHLNQLTVAEERANDGGTLLQKVEIKYDVKGLRQEKKVDANGDGTFDSTQRFAYDGWNTQKGSPVGLENYDVWADLDGTGSLTTRYLRGDVVDQVFARVDGSTAYWHLTDHLGSLRDVIDNSAVVKNTISYDAFGNILSESNSAFRGRYSYTSREWDSELQLQFNRARYYDPRTARWMSRDPLGFEAGDGNLYRYVHNIPTVSVDPSGYLPGSSRGSWSNPATPGNGVFTYNDSLWNRIRGINGLQVTFVNGGIPSGGFPAGAYWRSNHAASRVNIGKLIDGGGLDFAAADAELFRLHPHLTERPRGYTWHHVAESAELELVRTNIHSRVSHSGPAAPLRRAARAARVLKGLARVSTTVGIVGLVLTADNWFQGKASGSEVINSAVDLFPPIGIAKLLTWGTESIFGPASRKLTEKELVAELLRRGMVRISEDPISGARAKVGAMPAALAGSNLPKNGPPEGVSAAMSKNAPVFWNPVTVSLPTDVKDALVRVEHQTFVFDGRIFDWDSHEEDVRLDRFLSSIDSAKAQKRVFYVQGWHLPGDIGVLPPNSGKWSRLRTSKLPILDRSLVGLEDYSWTLEGETYRRVWALIGELGRPAVQELYRRR